MAVVFRPALYVPSPPPDIGWVGKSGSAFWILSNSLQLYMPTGQRQFTPGDTSAEVWRPGPQSNFLQLLGAIPAGPTPFRPNYAANFYYDVTPALWTGVGGRSAAMILTGPPTFFGAKGQSPSHRWNFDHSPDPVWTSGSRSAYSVSQPAPIVQNTATRSAVSISVRMGL